MHKLAQLYRLVFELLSRKLSYGLTVAAFSAGIGGTFTVLLLVGMMPVVSGKFSPEFVHIIRLLLIIPWITGFIIYGGLSRLGYAGLYQSAKTINRSLYRSGNRALEPASNATHLLALLKALNDFPSRVFLTAFLDNTIIIIAATAIGLSLGESLKALAWLGWAWLIANATYGGLSYMLAEVTTAKERVECKRAIRGMQLFHEIPTRPSFAYKLAIIGAMFMTCIFISNLLTYYYRDQAESVIFFIAGILIVILLLSYLVLHTFYRTISETARAIEHLKDGEGGILYSPSIDREIVNLSAGLINAADTINDYRYTMERKIRERTKALEDSNRLLAERDDVLQEELEMAAEVQRSMLYPEPAKWNRTDFAITYLPLGKVSGDYFDIFRFRESVYVLLVDVSGHGLPAALITMAAKETFSRVIQQRMTPSQIFHQVNTRLTDKIKTHDYLTAFLVRLDRHQRITFCNAAHQNAVVYKQQTKTVEVLESSGLMLGAIEAQPGSFEDHHLQLSSGDRVFIFTDGLIEQPGPDNGLFGRDRLIEAILQRQDESLGLVHAGIVGDLTKFRGEKNFTDDISIISFQVG